MSSRSPSRSWCWTEGANRALLAALAPLLPVMLSYVLSFIYVRIYWNNHHPMLFTGQGVSGAVLWANRHLLFWLSLFPFTSAWMGGSHLAVPTTAACAVVLLMAAIACRILQHTLIVVVGSDSVLRRAVGADRKASFRRCFTWPTSRWRSGAHGRYNSSVR